MGFAAAVAGLLAPRVRGIILLPALLLMLVLPGLTGIPVPGGAERPLAFFVAIAALLVLLWLEERKSWQLVAAAVLLSGAFLTKREGLLLGALRHRCRGRRVLGGPPVGVAAAGRTRSRRVRVGAALASVGCGRGLSSDAPEGGFFAFLDDFDRARDSLWLAVRAMFGYDLWLVRPVAAVVAAALAFLAGARRGAVFTLAFIGATLAANAWVTLTNPVTISLDYS